MSVENSLFLFNSTNDMNIPVWNNNGFRVIGKVIQIIEFLNLITFALEVEKIAVGLLNREDGDLFH